MNSNYRFTIFTSCYNSKPFIYRLYDSLKKQKFTNFEWLIIDDYSQDGTREILEFIKNDAPFDVRVLYNKTNEMISYCCNLAVKKAQGEFFLFLDHDDELVPHALERFNDIWENIEPEKRVKLAGMISNCQDQYGDFYIDELPEPPSAINYYDMVHGVGIKGEKFFCYLTEIIQKNNFSTVDRYVPENLMLLNISDNYDTFFFNENLRIYHVHQKNHQSLANQLANNWKFQFSVGMRFTKQEDINRRAKRMLNNPVLFFTTIVNYLRFSSHANISMQQSLLEINSNMLKLLLVIVLPIGKILYMKDIYLSKKKINNN